MPEARHAFKREAIEVQLTADDSILVDPIPWEQRNDFGDEVLRQHVEIMNEAVRLYVDPDTGVPQLEAKLAEKFSDPQKLFELGLTAPAFEKVKGRSLYMNQIVAILDAICEVNDLVQLRPLLDPNSTTPTMLGGVLSELLSGMETTSSQPEESGPSSSSEDSNETLSEVSPIPN